MSSPYRTPMLLVGVSVAVIVIAIAVFGGRVTPLAPPPVASSAPMPATPLSPAVATDPRPMATTVAAPAQSPSGYYDDGTPWRFQKLPNGTLHLLPKGVDSVIVEDEHAHDKPYTAEQSVLDKIALVDKRLAALDSEIASLEKDGKAKEAADKRSLRAKVEAKKKKHEADLSLVRDGGVLLDGLPPQQPPDHPH